MSTLKGAACQCKITATATNEEHQCVCGDSSSLEKLRDEFGSGIQLFFHHIIHLSLTQSSAAHRAQK